MPRSSPRPIADTPGLRLDPPDVETNLIWFEVDPDLGTAGDVAAALKAQGRPGPCRRAADAAGLHASGRIGRAGGAGRGGGANESCTSPTRERAVEPHPSLALRGWLAPRRKSVSMRIHPLHRWDLTPTEAVALQRELAGRVVTDAPLPALFAHRRRRRLLQQILARPSSPASSCCACRT